MDTKKTPLKSNKWIVPMVCVAVVVVLSLALYVIDQCTESHAVHVQDPTNASTAAPNLDVPNEGQTDVQITPSKKPVMLEPVLHPEFLMPDGNTPKKETFLEYNTLTKKDFKKVNGYVTCKTQEYWLGIDVSVYQEDIDWERVKAAGVEFVMVRLAYRGWRKDGPIFADTNGLKNVQDAQAAGLKVGVYFYSQATSVEEAVEEARFLLELLDGRDLEMPVVFDWELPTDPTARTKKVKAKTIHASAMAFCAEVESAGYRPMVYFNQRQGKTKYNLAELREAGIELWLAMYSNAMTYTYKVQMWQYTDNGRIPGIEGRVDIDLYFPED